MVSRRNYLIMTVMMFVLLFLFMSTRVFQVSRRGQDRIQTSEPRTGGALECFVRRRRRSDGY